MERPPAWRGRLGCCHLPKLCLVLVEFGVSQKGALFRGDFLAALGLQTGCGVVVRVRMLCPKRGSLGSVVAWVLGHHLASS